MYLTNLSPGRVTASIKVDVLAVCLSEPSGESLHNAKE